MAGDLFGDMDVEYATTVADRAIRSMSQQSVPVTPGNFSVWFDYAMGTSPALRKTIDVLIGNKRKFDAATYPELAEAPPYFKKEIKQSSEMSYDELRRYIRDLEESGFDVVRLRVQLQKKIAYPLITLVMAMIAIPFAPALMRSRRSLACRPITISMTFSPERRSTRLRS